MSIITGWILTVLLVLVPFKYCYIGVHLITSNNTIQCIIKCQILSKTKA